MMKIGRAAKVTTGFAKPVSVIWILLGVLLLGLATFTILNGQTLLDTFSALGYTPSEEMSKIKSSLELTPDADRIFNAARPVLNSKDDFNAACSAGSSDTSILGCYANREIHIYDIDAKELPGIRESTTAHELLHAVWSRLSQNEKSELTALLNEVYSDPKYTEILEADLKTYKASEREDELHSRVGTEIKDLPEKLEAHYQKYFTDQDKIVAFYESYNTPFQELKTQIETLGKELETLKSEIEQKTSEYETRANNLNAAISEFNNCANTTNCFTSRSAFDARRAELVGEQTAVNNLYAETDALIKNYNAKVVEYNDNILKNKDLENLINSNSKVNNI